jgi:nucleotide-binding universal stress UspA family protein
MTLEIDLVLAPVDTSDRSEAALARAVAVADRFDAALHVLHVVDEMLKERLQAGDVDPQSVADDQLSLADDVADRARAVEVTQSTAVGFSQSHLRQHPGSAILDVAEGIDADFVVVPREPGVEPGETLGKSAQYVVEYASQPVLSV